MSESHTLKSSPYFNGVNTSVFVMDTVFELDESRRCKYSSKRCNNTRAKKESTGEYLTLCQEHREKANINAKKCDRERHGKKKREKKHLKAWVEKLTAQRNRLLDLKESNKAHSIQNLPNILTNGTKITRDIQRDNFIGSYMNLVDISERLRLENEQYKQSLQKVWGRYTNLVNHQVHISYGVTSSPRAPLSGTYSTQQIFTCRPTPSDRIKSKQYRSSGNGQWLSFHFSSKIDENGHDTNILPFRESTKDIYFCPISDSMGKKLQAEAYEEGVSFTKVYEQEVKSGNRPLINEIEYSGWNATYYPITAQEAYPHLTQVKDLEVTKDKGNLDNMIRYDFVKRYQLKPHQNFDSMFTHIRECIWKKVYDPIANSRLYFGLYPMVNCVLLQNINDDTCITIRSYKGGKNGTVIYRSISMLSRYENEVHVSLLNPSHCISRINDSNEGDFDYQNASKYSDLEVCWLTHGHTRFSWYKVGDQDYEIRFGGTISLQECSLGANIIQNGEFIVRLEESIFQECHN